jgi:predicted RNase H-like HicB family nuclease
MSGKKSLIPKKPKKITATPKKMNAANYLQQPYARILIPEEDGRFSAELLEFPGCYAEGDTADEAYTNLEKAAKSWIALTLDEGQDIPPPSANYDYSGKVMLRLPKSLHRMAARKAERDGVSLNQCLVTAVAAWVGADHLARQFVTKFQSTPTQLPASLHPITQNVYDESIEQRES